MKRRPRLPDGTRKAATPWRKRDAPVESVRAELLRRKLNTVDDCQRLWEAALDPLALCVAVTLSELPRWLQDGLLAALIPDVLSDPFKRAWRSSNRDRMHAGRAWELILNRTHPDLGTRLPITWEVAPKLVSYSLRGTVAAGTPAAMRQSYMRVAQALARDPWRFWTHPVGFNALHLDALRGVLPLLEAVVANSKRQRTERPMVQRPGSRPRRRPE